MKGFTLIELLILCAIVALIVVAFAAVIAEANAPTFELKKSEWSCTKKGSRLTLVMIGKIPTQQPRTVCVQWSRR